MGLWSDRCRPLIASVLDALPVGATRRECERALSEAYPFGPRENHPYRTWLKESKAALDRRFAGRPEPGVPRVAYTLTPYARQMWLGVSCGWCSETALTSCFVCDRRRRAVEEMVKDPELLALLRAGRTDPVACEAARDRVEERTGERPEVRE